MKRVERRPPSKWTKLMVACGVVATIALLVVLLVSSLNQKKDEQSRAVCPPNLEDARSGGEESDAHTSIAILVDVPANDRTQALMIARDLEPLVSGLLVKGVRPELLLDFGGSTPLRTSECFDGTHTFVGAQPNSTVQSRLISAIGEEFVEIVSAEVMSRGVEEVGGPERLLKHGALNSSDYEIIALWSDLLSNSGECLDGSDYIANEETATALAERCSLMFDLSYRPEQLVITGAGTSLRSGQFQNWAILLSQELCSRVRGCYVN